MTILRAVSLLLISALGILSCTTPSPSWTTSDLRQKQSAECIIRVAGGRLAPVYAPLAEYLCERLDLADKDGIGIDIGSGPGNLIIELCHQTRMHWINADINPHYFSHFFAQAQTEGVGHRVSAIQADAHQLPFHDDYADVIVSRGTFHFWEDKAKAFGEIHRVLKLGGIAFVGRGFSPNLPPEEAKRIRVGQKADGFKMYDLEETAAELRAAMETAGIRQYEILIMQSPEDETILYGIWVEIRKMQVAAT